MKGVLHTDFFIDRKCKRFGGNSKNNNLYKQ